MNMHNFVSRQLCEYQSIFPAVASVLDHILLTNGTGYSVVKGMIVDIDGIRIDEYPTMTLEDWDILILDCHKKEEVFAAKYEYLCISEERKQEHERDLAEDKSKYYPRYVTDSDFCEKSLLQQIHTMQLIRRTENKNSWIRPYPFSKGYANIFELSENSPPWLVQIARNLCKAWIVFLEDALSKGDIWIKPSLRKKTQEQILQDDLCLQIVDEIRVEMELPKGNSYKEPENDYADESYTKEYITKFYKTIEMLDNIPGKIHD